MASKIKMWQDVINILKSRAQIGPRLRLRCTLHEEKPLYVSKPEDFELISPEGGCMEMCRERWRCGHACEYLCHSYARHQVSACKKPCERGRPDCGHGCAKRCSDPCGPCTVIVKDIPLPCGHFLPSIECWLSVKFSDPKARCKTRVKRQLSKCGHEVEMLCSQSPDDFDCPEPCGGVLQCTHGTCSNRCSSCFSSEKEAPHIKTCPKECGKGFTTCSHRCRQTCHIWTDTNCPPCNERCELCCPHSRCSGICGKDCVPCSEQCIWACEHAGRCQMPCGAPCDRLPCDIRCERTLECGHRCPSVCGEPCPSSDFCQVCCPSDIRIKVIELLEYTTYESLDLDVDPIIVLSCRHFYSRSFLDEAFMIEEVYTRNKNGQFAAPISHGNMSPLTLNCPECRMPISQIQRYNRIIKKAVLDNLLKNSIVRSNKKYIELETEFERFNAELLTSRAHALKSLRPMSGTGQQSKRDANMKVITERLEMAKKMHTRIAHFIVEVNEGRQPHMKVYKMSIAARSRPEQNGGPVATSPLDTPSPDIKFRLLGEILKARLAVLANADLLELTSHLSRLEGCQTEAPALFLRIVEKCESLLPECRDRRSECDERKYYALAVQLLLLQAETIALQIRSCKVKVGIMMRTLQRQGLGVLNECDVYFTKYASTKKYEAAAQRARTLLLPTTPFYQTVTADERREVISAMQGDFRGTGHWYYCRNGHPVVPSMILLTITV